MLQKFLIRMPIYYSQSPAEVTKEKQQTNK